ncbi:PREDICTED: pentatricopeptide repeat-containing protein At3g47530 isoform X1 [Lupinus angustifolius]|uniref:pentatricopeptide repeat-containing protein At3g47530 isoform X1 n=1 Tax=Lupinus angustifolius TaxID=3871 RepID=UPI00092F1632|nr:PREDICTED: pentatricopeptide repeat-containing protein At3g47530 isoform X1 [Lupinus angustifolius]
MLRAIWFSHSQRLVFVASNLKCLSRFNATIAIPIHLNKEMVISALKSISHKTQLLQIHAQILRTNLIGHPYVSLQFLSRVALSGPLQDPTYSQRFFEQINHPSVSHYNTMIRAFSMSHKPQKGLFLYRDMRIRGISPDPLSSTSAIKCCIKFLYLLGGVQVHCNVFKDGHQLDNLLLTAIMDLYSQCRKWDDACKVFDEMPHRDTVAWNVMISCCIRNNRTRDALSLFDVMQSESNRCEPDDVTCLLLLQACAHLNALEFGERIHGYIVDSGYGGALNLSNSLISMYSRCGSLDKAYEVFRGMRSKSVVSWSAMISGLASNRHGREAIEAFEEMLRIGITPDDQTFTGILSACSYSGLVNEGLSFFERMGREFGITPNIHHYGCMVDLLGRAGSLDKAYQLITSMVVEPDSTIWRTLLGACRIHGDVALGERVIGHLIELKAQEAGDYVLLLNIYSSAGHWEKVAEVRKLMKVNAIQTTPGCSTIELKGVVHEFLVDDVSHLRKGEIYEVLDEINKQLKIAGYMVEPSSELHKIDDKEKGYVLSHHSEKLAIAFGVLATPPGTKLRVANNQRICVDCHNFLKLFSEVYNRDVILRDHNRFHHFRGGHCSCTDYW